MAHTRRFDGSTGAHGQLNNRSPGLRWRSRLAGLRDGHLREEQGPLTQPRPASQARAPQHARRVMDGCPRKSSRRLRWAGLPALLLTAVEPAARGWTAMCALAPTGKVPPTPAALHSLDAKLPCSQCWQGTCLPTHRQVNLLYPISTHLQPRHHQLHLAIYHRSPPSPAVPRPSQLSTLSSLCRIARRLGKSVLRL